MKKETAWFTALVLVAVYVILFSYISYIKYTEYIYDDFDLAIYNQVTWNTLQGNFFLSSIRGGMYFKEHFVPILLLFLPIYALFSSPLTLLYLQALFLGLGGIIVFLIARRQVGNGASLAFCLLYLIYPALNYMNLFEFHPDAFAVFFLLGAIYFFMQERFIPFLFMTVLTLFCKEDFFLSVFGFSILALFYRRWSAKWMLYPAFISIAWFALIINWFMPSLNTDGKYLFTSLYSHLGSSWTGILLNCIKNPTQIIKLVFLTHRAGYVFRLFSYLGFLPLLGPAYLSACLPALLRNLLSSKSATSSIYCQYNAGIVPFMFVSAIYGFKRIAVFFGKYRRPASMAVFGIAVCFSMLNTPFCNEIPDIIFKQQKGCRKQLYDRFIDVIPSDAACVSTFRFLPRLSSRKNIYSFHYISRGRGAVEEAVYPERVDYALLDLADSEMKSWYLNSTPAKMRKFILDEGFSTIDFLDSVVLLKKDAKNKKRLFEILPKINKVRDIPSALEVYIGEELLLLGADIDKGFKGDVIELSLFWEVKDAPIEHNYWLCFYLIDRRGSEIFTKLIAPCYNIYSTQEWKQGQIIKGNYRFLLPKNTPGTYDFRLLVVDIFGGRVPALSSPLPYALTPRHEIILGKVSIANE